MKHLLSILSLMNIIFKLCIMVPVLGAMVLNFGAFLFA